MKAENMNIDFVITWVDPNDSEWLKEKQKCCGKGDQSDVRYRDWDFLKYWFRSVEKNAPWVNKIHFVTCGQKPDWLKENNQKINIVNHSDFMPNSILPTFNSVPIELYLHNIPNLSENFVYFNDDMFINSRVSKEFFFKNNKPCDSAILSAITPMSNNDNFSHCLLSDAELTCLDYRYRKAIRENLHKWFNVRYGLEQIRTILLLPWSTLPGIKMHHMPISYRRSTYIKLWDKHEGQLKAVSRDRFRNNFNINHWIFRYDQLMSGDFCPRNPKCGKLYAIKTAEDAKMAAKDIERHKHKMICINDASSNKEFDKSKKIIKSAFVKTYSNKSSFEK